MLQFMDMKKSTNLSTNKKITNQMQKSKLYLELEDKTDEIIKLGGVRAKEDLITIIRVKTNQKIPIEKIRSFLDKYESAIEKKLKVLGYGTKEAERLAD